MYKNGHTIVHDEDHYSQLTLMTDELTSKNLWKLPIYNYGALTNFSLNLPNLLHKIEIGDFFLQKYARPHGKLYFRALVWKVNDH